jgi:hypothetical protein
MEKTAGQKEYKITVPHQEIRGQNDQRNWQIKELYKP